MLSDNKKKAISKRVLVRATVSNSENMIV